jgi:3-deoxy-D-manno-octulosonic-acid transferase
MGLGLDILYITAAAVSSPVWGFRLWRTGKWRTDWRARFGHLPTLPATDRKTILIHAVSVGEVNAVRTLVTMLEELSSRGRGEGDGFAGGRPRIDARPTRVVVSVTTDTGLARARQLFEPAHAVVRFPFDLTGAVDRFLDAVRPDLVALVELEVWPNFLSRCARRGIPVCVINGRLSDRSFRRYRRFRPLLRKTFGRLSAAAVQTPEYAERFGALGVPAQRVRVLDTMKWDTAQVTPEGENPADAIAGARALAAAMGIDPARPLIVGGSTAPGEDKLLIDTCPPEAQLLLVPRKPEWFEDVAALAPSIIRRTQHPEGTTRAVDGARLFLLDTMGELRKAYALADVCLVGRSFLGLYGSDPIESAALGKPTVIGPFHGDFADTVRALQDGGGILVTDQPGKAAAQLLADKSKASSLAAGGRRVILSRQGATRRHAELLLGMLP